MQSHSQAFKMTYKPERVLYAVLSMLAWDKSGEKTYVRLLHLHYPKERSDIYMAILSGYTNTTGYVQPTRTLQPVASQTAMTPNVQQTPSPNLSQKTPEKQLVQTAKTTQETTDKSTKRFALRLTAKQRNQVKRLQKTWGLATESAVIKKLIEDSKEEKNTNDLALQIQELTAIKAELNRIGININQIAKKANQVQMSMADLNAVMQYMKDVCDVIYGKGLKQ